VINIENLTHRFDKQTVFDRANLKLNNSSLIGIVGENGVGKTTLVRLILNIIKVQSGKIEIEPNSKFGYLSQTGSNIDQRNPISVNEYLVINQIDHKSEIFQKMNLQDILHKQFKSLSGGQKQKLLIAVELLKKPDILILDEPTNALDTNTRKLIMHEVKKYVLENNAIVLMVSHDTLSIDNHCDSVLEIKNCKIHETNTKTYLKNQLKLLQECEEC
jgi:zinc/manganese transport system ATP-binding protein